MNNSKVTAIEDKDIPYGTYVWKMPDGRWIGDDEGNYLCIFSMYGDFKRIAELQRAVRSYGIESGVGEPYFLRGRSPVSDEEYQKQLDRQANGEIADEYDIPALVEELVYDVDGRQ